jgi:transcriptional regulator with XRE-family HTH domain
MPYLRSIAAKNFGNPDLKWSKSMSEFKSEKIKVVIKTLLKNQKKTFEQLAIHLSCSVPTIKRILGREDLSLSRLISICEFLDVSLAEVDALTAEIKSERFALNYEQNEFLETHPGHFSFLMSLCTGQSAEHIARKHKLSQLSVERYLIDLERIGLVRADGLDAKILFDGVPDFVGSNLPSTYFERTIKATSEFYIEWIRRTEEKRKKGGDTNVKVPKNSGIFSTMSLELSRDSYSQWQREQAQRLEELERRSDFEKKAYPKDQLMEVIVTAASAITENDDPLLDVFKDIWGPIANIR